MINLNLILSEMQLSRAALARLAGVSAATVTLLLNHGHWPRTPDVTHRMRQRITEVLNQHGVAPERVATAFEACAEQRANWTPHAAQLTEANASSPSPQANFYQPKDDDMLPPKSRITTEALDHFALERDPFTNEMRGVADVFINDNIRKVRGAVRNVAEYGGMLAVIAESGAGKSTVRKDLAHWIKTSNRSVIVIEPYVIGMEDDRRKGRPLVAEDIVRAIMRRLSPSTPVSQSQQKRMDQMHELLRASAATGNHHVLVIEEAHRLATPTLRHMKTFYELDDGFTSLLGILLIGQTELDWKLGDNNFEVREVTQRLEKRFIDPLDNDVEAYLRHKLERVGGRYDKVFAPDAAEAMVARLRVVKETRLKGHRTLGPRSQCYPLAINNLVSGAINLAHQGGEDFVTAKLLAQVGRED